MILDFAQWLTEAITVGNVDRAADLIVSYLNKNTHHKFFKMPGSEQFTNSKGSGFGIRLFFGSDAVRFNWMRGDFNSADLDSVDVWEGGESRDPSWHLEFDHELSLATILPTIASILSAPNIREEDIIAMPADTHELGMEEALMESAEDPFELVLNSLKPGDQVPLTTLAAKSGTYKVIQYIRAHCANLFAKDGRATIFKGVHSDLEKIRTKKDEILRAVGAAHVKIVPGPTGEKYTGDTKYDAMDKTDGGLEHLAYEDQLKDLESLVRLTIKGASNALFVAGAGGVGKTFSVEKALSDAGLRDGDGYFKITGSASAGGIYRELFKHRNDLILFDDADGALSDQDSRNLIKASTDTKEVRKLSWMKASKNLMDPDTITDADIEQGMLPTYYEFKGQIVFISNLSIEKLDPDKALRTRALMIAIQPTNEEIINFMKKICANIPLDDNLFLSLEHRQGVVDLIAQNKNDLNLRKLIRGMNIRAGAEAAGVSDSWERLVRRYS